jgi:hypothetical protein
LPDREPFNVSYVDCVMAGTDYVILTQADLFKIRDRNQDQATELKRLEARLCGQSVCMEAVQARAELARLKADYALLLQANHRLGFGSVDIKAELAIAKRDLATVRDHRDRLIESNRKYRDRLDAFGAVLYDAAAALDGAKS